MNAVKKYLATIGSIGGKKSRRRLTPAQARAMVKAREAKRPKKPKASARRANEKADRPVRVARESGRTGVTPVGWSELLERPAKDSKKEFDNHAKFA